MGARMTATKARERKRNICARTRMREAAWTVQEVRRVALLRPLPLLLLQLLQRRLSLRREAGCLLGCDIKL